MTSKALNENKIRVRKLGFKKWGVTQKLLDCARRPPAKVRRPATKTRRAIAVFKLNFLAMLKSNKDVLHTILFVLKIASRWYKNHLNRSSVKRVMTVLPKSRKAVSCSVGGNLKKERKYYLVKPNLFLLLWGMKITSFLMLGGNLLPNLNPSQAYIYPITSFIDSNPSLAPKRGAFIAPPPTLILHHLFANYFHSINLRVLHCARSWRKKQEIIKNDKDSTNGFYLL